MHSGIVIAGLAPCGCLDWPRQRVWTVSLGDRLAQCTTTSVACLIGPTSALTHHDAENGPSAGVAERALGRARSGAIGGVSIGETRPSGRPVKSGAAGDFLGVSFRKCLSYSRLPSVPKFRPARPGHVLSACPLGPDRRFGESVEPDFWNSAVDPQENPGAATISTKLAMISSATSRSRGA